MQTEITYRVQYRYKLYRRGTTSWSQWYDIALPDLEWPIESFTNLEEARERFTHLSEKYPNSQYQLIKVELTPLETSHGEDS